MLFFLTYRLENCGDPLQRKEVSQKERKCSLLHLEWEKSGPKSEDL